MKKQLQTGWYRVRHQCITGLIVTNLTAVAVMGAMIIDFDTAGNWQLGSGSGQLNHYDIDHSYYEGGWYFTGGEALRNTATEINGVAGALGTYSWRLRDGGGVVWTAAYQEDLGPEEYFAEFGFQARSWSASSDPAFSVLYSFNNGVDWQPAAAVGSAGILDNEAFSGTADWHSFSQPLEVVPGLAADQFMIRFTSADGERIMIDNFFVTTVPEPSVITLVGLFSLVLLMFDRRRPRPTASGSPSPQSTVITNRA